MFATLRRLLHRLFGHEPEPPSQWEQIRSELESLERSHGQAESPQDKSDTYGSDWINRPPAGGDWLRERLRSLPDEEKGQKPESPKHGHRR